jgi:hypothetical protein
MRTDEAAASKVKTYRMHTNYFADNAEEELVTYTQQNRVRVHRRTAAAAMTG